MVGDHNIIYEFPRSHPLFFIRQGGLVMDMLRIDGLYKHFGDTEVLRGLDLAVP